MDLEITTHTRIQHRKVEAPILGNKGLHIPVYQEVLNPQLGAYQLMTIPAELRSLGTWNLRLRPSSIYKEASKEGKGDTPKL